MSTSIHRTEQRKSFDRRQGNVDILNPAFGVERRLKNRRAEDGSSPSVIEGSFPLERALKGEWLAEGKTQGWEKPASCNHGLESLHIVPVAVEKKEPTPSSVHGRAVSEACNASPEIVTQPVLRRTKSELVGKEARVQRALIQFGFGADVKAQRKFQQLLREPKTDLEKNFVSQFKEIEKKEGFEKAVYHAFIRKCDGFPVNFKVMSAAFGHPGKEVLKNVVQKYGNTVPYANHSLYGVVSQKDHKVLTNRAHFLSEMDTLKKLKGMYSALDSDIKAYMKSNMIGKNKDLNEMDKLHLAYMYRAQVERYFGKERPQNFWSFLTSAVVQKVVNLVSECVYRVRAWFGVERRASLGAFLVQMRTTGYEDCVERSNSIDYQMNYELRLQETLLRLRQNEAFFLAHVLSKPEQVGIRG
jgi:hypothetical protein